MDSIVLDKQDEGEEPRTCEVLIKTFFLGVRRPCGRPATRLVFQSDKDVFGAFLCDDHHSEEEGR